MAKKAPPDLVPVALELGWTMAVLYRQDGTSGGTRTDRLPTEHELPSRDRINLEVQRAMALLDRLAPVVPRQTAPAKGVPQVDQFGQQPDGKAQPSGPPAGGAPAKGETVESIQAFQAALRKSNAAILGWLAAAGREFELAYQLGRSIRDTANPPLSNPATSQPGTPTAGEREAGKCSAVQYQLSHGRVAKLQEWLSVLSAYLPDSSAAVVSASLGRWGDLVSTVFDPQTPGTLKETSPWYLLSAHSDQQPEERAAVSPASRGRLGYVPKAEVASRLYDSLLPQGDVWLNLLVGAESTKGLLTPEGFVAAGEAALGRSARIIRRIVVHYWFLLLVVAGAVAAALYFAARDVGGAAKLWTQIATVGSGLGITATGIRKEMTTLAKSAESSLLTAEENDAMAWAVTSIPADLKLNHRGVRALRRSGIRGSVPLGRV